MKIPPWSRYGTAVFRWGMGTPAEQGAGNIYFKATCTWQLGSSASVFGIFRLLGGSGGVSRTAAIIINDRLKYAAAV